MKFNATKLIATAFIIFLALFLDQCTKNWATENLASPRFQEHTVSVAVDQAEQTPTLEALVKKRYPKNSEATNRMIAGSAKRNDVHILPNEPLQNGDVIAFNYVSLTVIDGYYDYTYARNTGAAFSLFADKSETFRSIFFNVIGVLAVLLMLGFILKTSWQKEKSLILTLACILGGALGNIVDRVRLGYVTDFISWHIGDHYWPTFNIADVFITGGVAFFFLDFLITSARKKTNRIENVQESTEDVQESSENVPSAQA